MAESNTILFNDWMFVLSEWFACLLNNEQRGSTFTLIWNILKPGLSYELWLFGS